MAKCLLCLGRCLISTPDKSPIVSILYEALMLKVRFYHILVKMSKNRKHAHDPPHISLARSSSFPVYTLPYLLISNKSISLCASLIPLMHNNPTVVLMLQREMETRSASSDNEK